MSPPPCESVLVVDDNLDMIATMRDVLEMHGVIVQTATSCAEVDRILAGGFRPAAAIIDLRLGRGESGTKAIRRMRQDPAHSRVPIIVMSGDVHAMRALGSEVDARLRKPFDVANMIEVLRRVCLPP